jgi:hypothetical protein
MTTGIKVQEWYILNENDFCGERSHEKLCRFTKMDLEIIALNGGWLENAKSTFRIEGKSCNSFSRSYTKNI